MDALLTLALLLVLVTGALTVGVLVGLVRTERHGRHRARRWRTRVDEADTAVSEIAQAAQSEMLRLLAEHRRWPGSPP